MNCLLDTHVFLWTVFSPDLLSSKARAEIENPENQIFVSSVTHWEISLKHSLGKLQLTNALPDDLPAIATEMGFDTLQLDDRTASSFYRLPPAEHKDPFDRLIVWQAICRNLVLVTKDRKLTTYKKLGLKTLWS